MHHGVDETDFLVVGDVGGQDAAGPDETLVQQVLAHGAWQERGIWGEPLVAVKEAEVGIGGVCDASVLDDDDFVCMSGFLALTGERGAVGTLPGVIDIVVLYQGYVLNGA